MYQTYTSSQLDNLEVLYASDCSQGFPLHFHDTYCVSLILAGSELVDLADRSLLALPKSLSITHPGEVHANPLPPHCRQSFVTLYVPTDVMRYSSGGSLPQFAAPVIQDPPLFTTFQQLVHASVRGTELRTLHVDEAWFLSLLRLLVIRHATAQHPTPLPSTEWFTSLDALIDERMHRKLTLDAMAQHMGLSKFKFARLFREARGIPPASYLSVRRIERAKEMLRRGHPLSDTALQVGFYDQAHFSRAFQRVTGVTPGGYRQAVEGQLQDFTTVRSSGPLLL